MFQRLDGVREANRCLWVALTPFILQRSRMRKRARTDLCGGRSAMIVPTATMWIAGPCGVYRYRPAKLPGTRRTGHIVATFGLSR